jgi:hypothetical protein
VVKGLGIVRAAQLTYGRYCIINGCNQERKSGHRYCPFHKRRLIYRGDAEQSKIPLKDINFARKTVQLLMAENQSNPAWGELMEAIGERWDAARFHVNEELNKSSNGKPMNRTYRNGLRICYGIFNTIGLEKTFITYCAWQYLSEFNPNLFITELAYRHQVVKSLRNQAHTYRLNELDKTTGLPKVYSSPLYMHERDTVWEIMSQIFGATGLQLYKQLERRAERLRLNKEKIYAAIRRIE